MLVPCTAQDRRPGAHRHVGPVGELLDQVVGHRTFQAVAPHQEGDAPGVPREVDGGLARGIGAAHDVDVVTLAADALGSGRPVVDAPSFEAGEALEAPVGHPGGDHDGVGRQLLAVGHPHQPGRSAHLESLDFRHQQHLGPEPARLGGGATGQVGARQPGREPQVVLDAGALPGLPADRLPFDQDRAQPL